MSQQVQIDYQGIAIQCESICEVAERRLRDLDTMLAKAKEASGTLLNEQSEILVSEIEKEKQNLIEEIQAVKNQAVAQAKGRLDAITGTLGLAHRLQQSADSLATKRMLEFDSLLHTLLGQSISDAYRKLRERNGGAISIDGETGTLLESINDGVLRQFTYLAYIKDNTLSGNTLLQAGKDLMERAVNQTYEERLEQEEAKIRAELEAARVAPEVVKRVTGESQSSAKEKLAAMREAATTEIVGEKVRQKSLKIIVDAIRQRGFIVDKKNIRIKHDTNEVILVALKASGEKAEFRIFLDGRFIYDFRGYEGQACQKDIEPFMHDLEEVYGIHVTKRTEIRSNPDKISTMKYQAIKTDKNRR